MKNPAVLSVEEFSPLEADFSTIIDTRSPAEFEEDHYPGAINCPVLSNEERIKVGTLYKQVSPFEANKVGAALVSRNIAFHLENLFAKNEKHWKPMVYCWRGGTRSGAMTHILREVGWKAAKLEGGYKAYRKFVLDQLAALPGQFTFKVVCGETGSAKSRLLEALAAHGAQVLDLEKLACHKGSVLGVLPDQPQPSQKMFESLVWDALRKMDPAKPVFIEAESKKIGMLRTPEHLFEAMVATRKMVRIQATVKARVQFLLGDYDYFLKDPESLKTRLGFLTSLHGRKVIDDWGALVDQGDWQTLVQQLLENHYDIAYRKSMTNTYPALAEAQILETEVLDQNCFNHWASELIKQ